MAPQRSLEESEELIRKFTKRENELAREDSNIDRTLERANKAWSFIYGIGGVLVFVILWAARTQWIQADHEARIGKLETASQAVVAQDTANKLLFQNMQTSIDAATKELDARRVEVKEVDELWWMKEHGISNKEEFYQHKGYAAPDQPIK